MKLRGVQLADSRIVRQYAKSASTVRDGICDIRLGHESPDVTLAYLKNGSVVSEAIAAEQGRINVAEGQRI